MFILRLRGRTRRMRVEQFIDSKEDNRRVHPCSDCYIVDLNLFHLNNLKPSSKFFTWFEVDSWNLVFFSTFRLPPWAKPRPNARITAWFCSVTRCWFSVASMVTTGWAWGRFGCGRVCEISVEILGLHITLPTVSDYQYPGRFGVGDFHLRCFDVLKWIFYEFQGGILSQSGQSSAKNPEGLGLLLPSSMVRFNPQVQRPSWVALEGQALESGKCAVLKLVAGLGLLELHYVRKGFGSSGTGHWDI